MKPGMVQGAVGELPRRRLFASSAILCGERVGYATRGQTDIRGLATAGRGFGWIASACLAASVDPLAGLLIVESRVDPRAATTALEEEADQVAVSPP